IGQGTNCSIVAFATPFHKFVMRFGPRAPSPRMISEFLKRLSHEFWTGVTPMHETLFTALLSDWCDSGQFLHFRRGLETIPIRAERRSQARSQGCTRPGEAF